MEEHKDYKDIISLILRSFKEGTDYSDGTDIIALVEEIRDSEYYIPELSFVAELDGKIVGHFLFSRFPLSSAKDGGHGGAKDTEIVMLAPVSVHADYLRKGVGNAMLRLGIERVKELGYKTVFWSFAYADWDNNAQISPEAAIEKVISGTHNGEVILLHPTSATNAEILDELLTKWESAGYRFATIDTLF